MGRFFNTAGPIRKDDHYYVEPLERMDLEEILALVGQKKYFIFHAPRQTGKTSFLLSLMKYLNKEGKYKTLYTNIEKAQAARENVKEGIQAVLTSLANEAYFRLDDSFMYENWKKILEHQGAMSALQQLLLQAFLQRIVNGGGRVEREYGLGRQRTDLLVVWPCSSEDKNNPTVQEVVIEMKILYGTLDTTIQKGLKQTKGYMDKCGTSEGFLIVFDRSPDKSWDEKIFTREETCEGATIGIYGM